MSNQIRGLTKKFSIKDGRTLTLMQFTFGLEAEMEAWIAEQALSAVRLNFGRIADLTAVQTEIMERQGSGGYSYGTKAWADALTNDKGFSYYLWLRLRDHHPELEPEDCRSIYRNNRGDVLDALSWLDDRTEGVSRPLSGAEIAAILKREEEDSNRGPESQTGDTDPSAESS